MISAVDFVKNLQDQRFDFFTGVPCSFFQDAINCVLDTRELQYTIVPNEGSALAAASGASMAGRSSCVMIQNSGFGNLINPLTSLNMIYRIPVLLLISGRAYGIPDEPQHEIIGKTMGQLLDVLGIQHRDLPKDAAAMAIALGEAVQTMKATRLPYAFFVKKGTIGDYRPRKVSLKYPLKRIEAIRIIAKLLTGDEYLISTTGMPSRELFSVCDRARNFYMQGSMGHAPSIGLGLALSNSDKKVILLDGDGALLMHMGILSSIGHYRPKNLYHVVLDNESYETTGDQDTTSPTTDFKKIAAACGYLVSEDAVTESELRSQLNRILKKDGPAFLRVKINRLPTPEIPRITTKYRSEQIADNFSAELTGKG